MGAGRVLCDDVLRRRMRTCVLSVSSTVGWSVGLSILALRLGTKQKLCSIIMPTLPGHQGNPKLFYAGHNFNVPGTVDPRLSGHLWPNRFFPMFDK